MCVKSLVMGELAMGKYGKPLVEVEWFDAETTHGWETDEEVNSENVPIFTVGFLIKRTEDLVVIASSIDKLAGTQSNGRIKIPVAMIQTIRELTGTTKKARKVVECEVEFSSEDTPVDPSQEVLF